MANKNKFDFENHGEDAVIYLYGEVGSEFSGITSDVFATELDSLGSVKNIDVRINSEGGSVFEGFAIYNHLKEHPANVRVFVDGLAASIASVIAMAGNSIEMARNSYMMIHNAHGGVLLVGDAEQLEEGIVEVQKRAALLRKLNASIAEHYSQRTRIKIDSLLELMNKETWMTASEAVKNKFADRVGGGVSIAACVSPDRFGFKNIPAELLEPPKTAEPDLQITNSKSPDVRLAEIGEKLLQGRNQHAA